MAGELPDALDDAAQDVPADLGAWLGRLVLLYGVPFSYVIPDEAMLPRESLRFFFVDPIWIQHLVQGACSIGNTDYGDTLIDRAMDRWVQPNQPGSGEQGAAVRKAAASVRDGLRHQYESQPLPEESDDLDWPLTGFLLRSGVVTGWRGLEIMAFRAVSPDEKRTLDTTGYTDEQKDKLEKEDVAPLKALRIEQLSPDVMLGIFNGIIAQLVIRQPQEGLHFGLTRTDQASATMPSYGKTLRELGYKDPARAGEILHDQNVDLAKLNLMRETRGVIDIAGLVGTMQHALASAGELAVDSATQQVKFTSAEFAVQMIEAAGEFTFVPTRAS
jgi:hypothetical protein